MPVTPEEILTEVKSVGVSVGGLGGQLGGIETFLGVGGGGDLLGQIRELILDSDFLKELLEKAANIVGELCDKLVEGFGGAFATPDLQEKFWNAIADLVSTLLDILSKALDSIGKFPSSLSEGPLDVFAGVRDLGKFLDGCGRLVEVEFRIDAVGASLKSFFNLTNDSGIEATVFGGIFKSFTDTLKAVLSGSGDISQILFDQIKLIIFPKDLIVEIIRKMAKGEIWAWGSLPGGLRGGQLNEWLNNPATFEPLGGGASQDEEKRYRDTQRQFRIRLVAAADSYLRRKLGEESSPLSEADGRISAQSISDVIIILLENIVGFALEPECYPQIEIEWDGMEDLGFRLGAMIAKQLRLVVRGTLGLLLRGVWEYSLHSDTLVEMIATVIGATVSAFVEGCFKQIAFSFQIVSRYPNASVGSTYVALSWKSLETIEDTGLDADQLEYVALFRGPCDSGAVIPSRIEGLVKDIGAYIDATYRQAKFDNKFIQLSVVDKVVITRAEVQGNDLLVWATTTAAFQLPQPVLRLYVCCEVLAMRPGSSPSDPYTVSIKLPRRPRCSEVFVLSNRGGAARRPLIIA